MPEKPCNHCWKRSYQETCLDGDDVRENFKKRQEDPNFQARSSRHKDNKIRGSERDGNKIVAGHHQGSISSVELAQHMRKEKGMMPSAADLFLRSHSKIEGSQRVLATDKARRTMVEYERLMGHYQSQGIQKHPDMVFYEAVGGHKKRQVYGLGESAPMYFEPSTFRSSRASSYGIHSMMSID